ncbi:MAG: dehydrogenase [Polaromonas sp. 39-63-203]|jgi:NAD(P)-dependent dehydrogenase (short-subunit alcohol dehydrogenase family)|uniref:SDR family NAD(P)-dependent oxidoreductase n=1 Tax=Polaromonas sp. TaxID=1869339 RepID=UPI000BD23649|nr:SDR family oxidoreductase [Polaromonas sp.]OYY54112.1 MAG: dehydrogenase [Polaromonas sp. 35-63-240]OYZ01837.1 MAG: dehydrogenase [Polaromonas sp. 28-63-22]OYZ85242.1 MAG: dehydrogenase [Polaromonas sp. 24-62-144]OZB01185.1 MAG: dehydrogenase [Polaromonas sp. 39-63-203]HQS32935.1 SDR family oxidoreductase [Polaromonas sp.]
MINKTSPNATEINFGLAGRVCLVTGGAQGIGEACIRRFARESAQVVIADIDNARGAALAAELGGLYVHCDVGDKAQVDALVAQTVAAHGRIDVLVNNAGIFKAADFLDVSEADFDAVLRINLKGSFLVGQAVARVMASAEARTGISGSESRGSIINMSSVNAVLTIPTIASYNVSKGGINQLTRVMALALADKGIRVNAVAPGTIATELAAKAVLTSEEAKAKIMSRTPMKRLGQPSEIADTVAYLASDAASYITGEIVVVDGGRMTLNYTVAV